jgi:hypothetical protein
MKITRRALVRNTGPYSVEITNPEIAWEANQIVIRKSKVSDGTVLTPTKHNYEITITLDEFRKMVRAFNG